MLTGDAVDAVMPNGKFLGTAQHPWATSDFASYLVVAHTAEAKVIVLRNAGTDITHASKQAVKFGLDWNQNDGERVWLKRFRAAGDTIQST